RKITFLALPKVVPSSPDSLGASAESASPGVAPHKAGRDSPSALTPPMRSHSRRLTRSARDVGSSWIESKGSRLSETAVLRSSKLEFPNLNPSLTPLPALNLHLTPYSGGLEETVLFAIAVREAVAVGNGRPPGRRRRWGV